MIKKLTNIVLYSSIFISIGSAALVLRTFYLFDLQVEWSVVIFVFFSTLFTYNITKIIPLWNFWNVEHKIDYDYNERNKWNLKHKNKLLYLTVFSVFVVISFTFRLSLFQLLFLSHLGLISVFYAIPIFSGKALRAIPLIKIFLIGYVWASMSVLPFFKSFDAITLPIFYLFVDNLLFIIAITIPFDIRDFTRDKSQRVITLPTVLGLGNAKKLAVLLLVFSTILSYLVINNHQFALLNLGLNALFIPILFYSKEKHNEYYYLGLIDGMLILRLLLFFLI